MDREKLLKVLALTSSDQEGEALAAFRKAKDIIEGGGLALADVISAGLDAMQRGAARADDAAAGLNRSHEIFEHIREASERRRSKRPARKPQPTASTDGITRIIGVPEIPDGAFAAALTLNGQSTTHTGALMLIIKATMVSDGGRLELPSIAVSGRLAQTLEEMFRLDDGEEVEATIRVRKPFQAGSMPTLASALFG